MGNTNVLALQRIQEVVKILPKQDILSFFKVVGEAYREHQVTEREIAQIQMQREIALREIELKYDLYRSIFEHIFRERRDAIDKTFELIDKGMNENNQELIASGMHHLSSIVRTSPFNDIDQLRTSLESNSVIEI
ncbi:hypothetical protein [Paenisporosarcina antarctica]|uniref:Uncharacterized protein n=1 Tax=Paenisporosarcina antarctica TaxID=417367 RepID=A0A4P6ZZ19_9BACL|nr:hypothetical protein [Paenisporosarcina antarctica]QBP41980.1 hypothetical protein E2636_12830 [Paenisporosarcina antarctica]